MDFFGLTLWQASLPIFIGIAAGLITNAVAIWMLFHPYKAVRIGPIQILPMGAIPKEIDRISRKIGETIGKELLTRDDIARTLSSPTFRTRFDEAVRDILQSLLQKDVRAARDILTPEQAAGLQTILDRLVDKVLEAAQVYLASDEWEDRVRGFARGLSGEFRDRPFSVVLTAELQNDLQEGLRQLWSSIRDSPEFARVISDALDRGIERMLVSEKPVRDYVPAGAVNLGESVVSHYLPVLLDRLGSVLDDPETRVRLQDLLRKVTDRLLDAQKSWRRVVGRLIITERTLSQTVTAIEQGGVEEIAGLLREPDVQARIAEAVNKGVEDLLDKPVAELLRDISPERAERFRNTLVERVLYLFRHPTTEEIVLTRLNLLVAGAAEKRVGDLLAVLGEERSRELTDRAADWIVEALRGPRSIAFLRTALENRTSWMLSVPIGRIGDYVPSDAVSGVERTLLDRLWEFMQSRVPSTVAELPVAEMVEAKLRSYPIQKIEELVWRVNKKELVLIINLGGFLGALVGAIMLTLDSLPAGLIATGIFLLLSFAFINLKK